MRRLNAIETWVVRGEEVLIFVSILALIVILTMQVLFRFVLQAPLAFTEEGARLLFTWLIFVGAARALYVSQHFMVDIVYINLPLPLRHLAGYLSDAATIILAMFLAWAGYGIAFHGGQILPVLRLPVWTQTAAFPVGMALLAFHAICIMSRHQHVGDDVRNDFEE